MSYKYKVNGQDANGVNDVQLRDENGTLQTLVDQRGLSAEVLSGNVQIKYGDGYIGGSQPITAYQMRGAVTLAYESGKVAAKIGGDVVTDATPDALGISGGGSAGGLISIALDGLVTLLGSLSGKGEIVKMSLKHGDNCTIAASGSSDTIITLNEALALTPTAYVLINDAVCSGSSIPTSEFLVLFVMGTSKFELAGGSKNQLKTFTTASQAAISGASSFTVKGHNQYLLAAATNARTITAYFITGETS